MPRDIWIVVNWSRIYLDPEGIADGKLRLADPDVLSEQCEDCAEDILETGSVEASLLGPRVVCSCGARYLIESDPKT